MKSYSHNSMSRRSMLLTSGTVVVAGLAPTQLAWGSSFGKDDSEIKFWSNYIGQLFSANLMNANRGTKDRSIRVDMQLLDVADWTSLDPKRPKQFRSPFSLFFKLEKEGISFPSGNYKLSNRKLGKQIVFMNEVMDMETGEFVVEAVFG